MITIKEMLDVIREATSFKELDRLYDAFHFMDDCGLVEPGDYDTFRLVYDVFETRVAERE